MGRLLCLMEKNWDPQERSPHPVNTKSQSKKTKMVNFKLRMVEGVTVFSHSYHEHQTKGGKSTFLLGIELMTFHYRATKVSSSRESRAVVLNGVKAKFCVFKTDENQVKALK